MNLLRITDLSLENKKILIRVDFNVPISKKKILSDVRIQSSIPTIKYALENKAKVILASHLGRPTEGVFDEKYSLQPIVDLLRKKYLLPIKLVREYLDGINFHDSELIMLENVRFNIGEIQNDESLGKKYAALCDIFVMDAFGTSHRKHASTYGVAKYSIKSCIGLLFSRELNILKKLMKNPLRPMVSVLGGSKISSKLPILHNLGKISDTLLLGGGIANTFLASQGYEIGKSICEFNFIPEAKKIYNQYNIFIPSDVRVTNQFSENSLDIQRSLDKIKENEQILDLGDKTINRFVSILKSAKSIIWNGPMGVFEFSNFRKGTEVIAKAIANSQAFSIVGGGDTLSAVKIANVYKKISYISTGGGAFLEFISGKEFPIISILKKKSKMNYINNL